MKDTTIQFAKKYNIVHEYNTLTNQPDELRDIIVYNWVKFPLVKFKRYMRLHELLKRVREEDQYKATDFNI